MKPSTQEQFEVLLEQHRGILYKIARLYGRSREDQQDLAQEIAVQLWRSFETFDPGRAKFSTWMYRVALNVAVSYQRRERIRAHEPLDELLPAAPAAFPPDEVRMLYDWIGRLEPVNRALMLLHLEGFHYEQIAATLGISPTNTATRLSRLKEAMRKDLSGGRDEAR